MALMQITIIPLGTSGTGVGEYIADVELYLRRNCIDHQLQDMATVIQGNTDDLFRLAADIHNLPFRRGVQRVVTHITVDDRRDLNRGIGDKQQSVYRLLANKE